MMDASSVDRDDHVAFLVTGIDVSVGFHDLLERIDPVDDGLDLARLRQISEQDQIGGQQLRRSVVD
jgi:hypothetical protein